MAHKRSTGWVNSIIVNGNEGSVQTSDISVDTGKDIWLVVKDADNFEVSYEEPQVDEAAEPATEAPAETAEAGNNNSAPIVIGIVVIAVAVVIIVVVAKKMQK